MPNAEKVILLGADGATIASATNPVPVTTETSGGTSAVNIAQVAGATTVVGHGVAAAALRVELPTDGTGVVGLIAGTALVGKVGVDQTTLGTTNGVNRVPLPAASDPFTKVTVNISTATTTAVVAGTAAQTVRVYKIMLNVANAQTLNITSSGGTSLSGAAMTFGAGGGLVLDFDGAPWFTTVSAEGLSFVTTTTGVITGVVYYIKS